MATKRVALIIPLADRANASFTPNSEVALLFRSLLQLWGQSADILVAGDISKTDFQANYDLGIVPYCEFLPTSAQIYDWIDFTAGDKPLYLMGYRAVQGTNRTPGTGVLGTAAVLGNPTDSKFACHRALWHNNMVTHVQGWTARISSVYHALRVDEANPNLSVLLRPEPGLHPSTNYVFIARWHNRYFMPSAGSSGVLSPWMLPWIMANEGATPGWVRPITGDIDHPVAETPGRASVASWSDDYYLQTMQWLRTFCQNTGLVLQCGCTTNGNTNLSSNWRALHRNARTLSSQLTQIHQMVVQERNGRFPCCLHDHAWTVEDTSGISNRTVWQNSYGTFYDRATRAAFRAHWKGSLQEMRNLSFDDCWCGSHRYLNFAKNIVSDNYLRFLSEETPVRAVRQLGGLYNKDRSGSTLNPWAYFRNPFERKYGIEIMSGQDMLFQAQLDYTTQPVDRAGISLASGYRTSGESGELGFARYLGGFLMGTCFRNWLLSGAVLYLHNDDMSFEHPTPAMRVWEELNTWRQLLTGWVQFGSVSDIVAWRKRARNAR